jgi:ABC-type glutathione transport system ATPase component
MALIEIRNLMKIFPHVESPFGGKVGGEVCAVDDVSLDIHAGETLGLVGESGSGKSTLGRLILRLIEPTSGSISFEGRDLLAASRGDVRRLRRDLQIIFQDPFASLDPRYRVEDIIAEPLIIHGLGGPRREGQSREEQSLEGQTQEGHGFSRADPAPKREAASAAGGIRTRVGELLRAVGLDESARMRYPHEFSGGQRQRIGIARALALRPKFIVCDEPVSALDVSVGAQIVNLLAQLQRDFGLTYLFISHSMPVVRYLSTRIAVMYRGKIVEVGDTAQITERPAHAYTRSLLEATPELLA